tara:strand:- start:14 stop:664 length:651 start_codon:yes stop_codon:yes gene_type:complete
MSSLELGYHPILQNYGYLIDKISPGLMQELMQQINRMQNDFSKEKKANYKLVGEISNSYEMKPQKQFTYYLRGLTQQLENQSGYLSTVFKDKEIPPLDTNQDVWVNFQQKHEYNPPHNHAGLYSYVVWYQIPYTFKNKEKYSDQESKPRKNNSHGRFSFFVPTTNPGENIREYRLNIDKSKEGYIAIFPSNLYHTVYPFHSSDEYRITIAGNIIEK